MVAVGIVHLDWNFMSKTEND